MLGATNEELAAAFEVSSTSIDNWIADKPEFKEAVTEGRLHADGRVASALFSRAVGYSHPDTEIKVIDKLVVPVPITKHYPPDVTACIFWLKNRRKVQWRDKHEHTHGGPDGGAIPFRMTDTELALHIVSLLKDAKNSDTGDDR